MPFPTRKKLSAIVSTAVAAACLAGSASAESLARLGETSGEWRKTLTFYAFLPARTTGTSTVAGSSVPLDLDLGEAIDLLDFAMSGRLEAWRDNWGIIFDANYVALEADGNLPGPGGAAILADIRQKWFGIMGAYKVAEGTNASGRRYAFDLQAGARYNSIRQEISITPPGIVLGGDEGWWEPVIGARAMWELNDDWTGVAFVDLGGFGAGGNDLQVNANIGVDWMAWERTSVFFGYRYFSVDYSTTQATGPFAYDIEQHGPVVGVKVRF